MGGNNPSDRTEAPSGEVTPAVPTGPPTPHHRADENTPSLPPRPPAPPFSSSLPEVEPIPRPRRVAALSVVAMLAALTQAALVGLSFVNSAAIRSDLFTQLEPEATEFRDEDVQRAVDVLFYVAGGLTILIALLVIYNANNLISRRSTARPGLTVAMLVGVLVWLTTAVVRLAENLDLALAATSVIALVGCVLVAFTEPVSAWLHQVEPKTRIPMDPALRAGRLAEAPGDGAEEDASGESSRTTP